MCLSLCSFSSGSSGNCVFVSSNNTGLLIDAGISARKLEAIFCDLEIAKETIKGILLTHLHNDHIAGLNNIIKKFQFNVYLHNQCLETLIRKLPTIDKNKLIPFENDFFVEDIFIRPFRVSHDVFTVGYAFHKNNIRIGYATDLGNITKTIENILIGSDLLFLESNHDVAMVQRSTKYTRTLKERILSSSGHLSNEQCAVFAAESIKLGTKQLVLGHLSDNNNTPQIAFDTVKNILEEQNLVFGKHYFMEIAKRDAISNWFVAD